MSLKRAVYSILPSCSKHVMFMSTCTAGSALTMLGLRLRNDSTETPCTCVWSERAERGGRVDGFDDCIECVGVCVVCVCVYVCPRVFGFD